MQAPKKKSKKADEKAAAAEALFEELVEAKRLQSYWVEGKLQWCWREQGAWWYGPIPSKDEEFQGFLGRALKADKEKCGSLKATEVLKDLDNIGRVDKEATREFEQQAQLDLMKGVVAVTHCHLMLTPILFY